MDYITKSTGKEFEVEVTGAQRDSQEDKPRYDLIGLHGLRRLAGLYARGAKKYQERNWEKGQRVSRTLASLWRHVIAYQEGERSEDHLAAIAFNAFSLMHVEEQVALHKLPQELLDLPFYCDCGGAPWCCGDLEQELGAKPLDWFGSMVVEFLDEHIGIGYTSAAIRSTILPRFDQNTFNIRLVELMNSGAITGFAASEEAGANWLYKSNQEPPQPYVPMSLFEPCEDCCGDDDGYCCCVEGSRDGDDDDRYD